jgi:hypothetical protein
MHWSPSLCLSALALATALAAQTPRPPEQPVAFSHRQHAAAPVPCALCHPNAGRAERAGLPSTGQCMACHDVIKRDSVLIQKLASFQKEAKPIPWVRIYRLPDFVFFSHGTHANAKVACAECHGPVPQRDALAAEIIQNMKNCMDCHRLRKARNDCHLCHELGQ